jgi:hypothetical protein
MISIATLISNLFADSRRTIEDQTAGFLGHNTSFQAAKDPKKFLANNQTKSQALATEVMRLTTIIGTSQADQQVGRTLTEVEKKTALERLSFNFSALHNDYLIESAEERARLLQIIFPHGMDDFTSASYTTLPTLLGVVLSQVQDPKNNVPAVFTEKTVAGLSPFADVRASQVAQQEATAKARRQLGLLLSQLQEQCTRNYHALCFVNEDDRSSVATFFNSRYFGEPQATAHPGVHAGKVAKMRTNQVVNLAEAPARYVALSLKVDENRTLAFYRTDDPKAPAPANALLVDKNSPCILPLADVPGTGAFLVVRNDGAYVGHYVAELLTA